jgi:hypothetical protein
MTSYGKSKKMKRPRTEKPKTQKGPSNDRGRRGPPNMSALWGRGASEYRPGLFTKRYLVEHGEASAADIYYALSQQIERLNKERIEIGERPFRRPNYSSFSRYFHWFLILGLIERTDKREPAIYDFLQKRVFYRLTEKGEAEVKAWQDPVRAAHPEFV